LGWLWGSFPRPSQSVLRGDRSSCFLGPHSTTRKAGFLLTPMGCSSLRSTSALFCARLLLVGSSSLGGVFFSGLVLVRSTCLGKACTRLCGALSIIGVCPFFVFAILRLNARFPKPRVGMLLQKTEHFPNALPCVPSSSVEVGASHADPTSGRTSAAPLLCRSVSPPRNRFNRDPPAPTRQAQIRTPIFSPPRLFEADRTSPRQLGGESLPSTPAGPLEKEDERGPWTIADVLPRPKIPHAISSGHLLSSTPPPPAGCGRKLTDNGQIAREPARRQADPPPHRTPGPRNIDEAPGGLFPYPAASSIPAP